MSEPIRLETPFTDTDLSELRAGDAVLLSGIVYTARDAAHARFAEAIAAGEPLPIDFADQIIYFVGPTPARPGHVIGSAGPTTASRMDPFSPLLIERGLKGMIGKGRRSPSVKESMLTHGCVYFGAVEGTAALLSQKIVESEVVAYEDLGTEAIHRLRLRDFPAVVVNDLHGNDLYEIGPSMWARNGA
ncbi:Fe-S-containing hydro-lyase [Microbacterium trichothecenolyticum]|uniref:Fe-S-containing hydro-lyase n=1 Tax=Microbacterium trichothecenolyticum TaxID=69370 RepID=UPI001C6DD7F1|nr:Fe-S-containing hydro-lyase [Microbacterium trichothecenolyticum]MBW9122317.1 Fe-S-containing hydro-lyase [Microbacterium trichothecenolyticum]